MLFVVLWCVCLRLWFGCFGFGFCLGFWFVGLVGCVLFVDFGLGWVLCGVLCWFMFCVGFVVCLGGWWCLWFGCFWGLSWGFAW